MKQTWMRWCRGVLLWAAAAGMGSVPGAIGAEGGITISRSVNQETRIFLAGIKGDDALNRAVGSLLAASGWLEVVNDPAQADCSLTGVASGGHVRFALRVGQASLLDRTIAYSTDAPRDGAKEIADAVLIQLFGKYDFKGLCRSQIAFCVEESPGKMNLYLCDLDGGNFRRLTEFSDSVVEPSWMPDGKSVVYTKYNDSNTSILQTMIQPVKTRTLATYNGMNVGVAVNPDGRSMALVMSKDRQVDLYLRALSGGALRRLTSDSAVEASPTWNPAGNTICFAAGAYAGAKLYYIAASGGNSRLVPGQKGDCVKPNWSSDNQIVFSTKRNGAYVLAVLDFGNRKENAGHAYRINGDGGLVMAANPGGSWESPSWAPDNRHVVCSLRQGRSATLAVVDTWTGTYRKLPVPVKGKLLMPSWSPLQK